MNRVLRRVLVAGDLLALFVLVVFAQIRHGGLAWWLPITLLGLGLLWLTKPDE